MSAFPPKADMCGALAHACYGPKAGIEAPALIDHLIRACEYRLWHGDAELLCNRKVDDQLKSGGLLHGQVGWPGAFKNLINKSRSSAKQVRRVGPVGQKASDLHQPARHSNEDEFVLFCEIPDSLSV